MDASSYPPYADNGPVKFHRSRDLGDVIRDTFAFLRETLPEWGPAVVMIGVPLYVVSSIASAFVAPDDMVGIFLIGLVNIAASVVLSAAAFGYVRLYRQSDHAIEVADVWAEAKRLIGPLFGFTVGTSLLFGLVLLVFLGPVFLVAGVGGLDVDSAVSVVVMAGLVTLMLIVGLAFLTPYYVLGLVSRVLDEEGFIDAYKRAAMLIKPHRGLATGTSIVLSFITFFLAGSVAGVVEGVMTAAGVSAVVKAIATLLSLAVTIPAAVFLNVGSAFLFGTLVEREQGTTLDAEIEAIREGVPDAPRGAAPHRPEAVPETPDTRGFAERLRDSTAPPEDGPSGGDAPPSGFRGGGFEGPA